MFEQGEESAEEILKSRIVELEFTVDAQNELIEALEYKVRRLLRKLSQGGPDE